MQTRPDEAASDAVPGVWCVLGSAVVAQRVATAGFGWICLDAQHGAFDRGAVLQSARALAPFPAPLAIRVSQNDTAEIGHALDVGAQIVIVPMVSTPDDARRAANAAAYPPRGGRSFGHLAPTWRGSMPERPRLWVMIETAEAVDNAAEIAAVEGVDGVFVGPFDLALSLGVAREDLLAGSDGVDHLARIVAAARGAGVELGAFGGAVAPARTLAALGFEFVAVTTDAALLDDASTRAQEDFAGQGGGAEPGLGAGYG